MSVREDEILFEGRRLKRMRIVLMTSPCSVATCTMCHLPNQAGVTNQPVISAQDLVSQFESAFSNTSIDKFQAITVYTNGNFFAESEIPAAVRRHIFERVGYSRAETLTVESLPQFITREKLEEAKNMLAGKRLITAIGLQSADDMVREVAVNSSCTKPLFERAVSLLREHGATPLVFLMIKPPFLTESEAIEDALGSIRYISSLGINNSILCPLRIESGTVACQLHEVSGFRPPWLWSVIEILKRAEQEFPGHAPIVATSLLKDSMGVPATGRQLNDMQSSCQDAAGPSGDYRNDSYSRTILGPSHAPGDSGLYATNCPQCHCSIICAFERANSTNDISGLLSLTCECKERWRLFVAQEDSDAGTIPLAERISRFLATIAAAQN